MISEHLRGWLQSCFIYRNKIPWLNPVWCVIYGPMTISTSWGHILSEQIRLFFQELFPLIMYLLEVNEIVKRSILHFSLKFLLHELSDLLFLLLPFLFVLDENIGSPHLLSHCPQNILFTELLLRFFDLLGQLLLLLIRQVLLVIIINSNHFGQSLRFFVPLIFCNNRWAPNKLSLFRLLGDC